MRKWSKSFRVGIVCALLAVLLMGCGSTKKVSLSEESSSDELPEVYQQMLLYIQAGLYEYGIDGTYQVYFGAVEEDGRIGYWRDGRYEEYRDGYLCEMLLEGEGNLWMEKLAYSYDKGSSWYTFYGQYEPIFGEGSTMYEDSEFVEEMRKNYVYTSSVSGEMHLPYPTCYHAESGPVERDVRVETCFHGSREGTSYFVETMLYTYVDERLGTMVTILYPAIWIPGAYDDAEKRKLQDSVNEQIRTAFFYSYYGEEGVLQPQKELYGSIDRNYIITRRDDNYLSMRIYEFNSFRRAAHPNEWETGITIDMHTGKVLRFSDVVGEDCDLEAFIDKGAFRCMWFWENDTGEYWLEHFYRRSSWDSYFYLTDDTLGLITEESRYYTNIEADFEDLGISAFVTVHRSGMR